MSPVLPGLIAAWLLLAAQACTSSPDVFDRDLSEAVNASAEYLAGHTGANGMFQYRVNMNPDIRIRPSYNIVRHAGAIYALNMYTEFTGSESALPATLRAGEFMFAVTTAPPPSGDGMLAVWSIPKINHSDKPLQAKLGASGLGLAALVGIDRIHPGLVPVSDLRKMGMFLVFMQREDGSFVSKLIPSKEGRSGWASLYYPGEAVLGLLSLYEIQPSEVWLSAAIRGLEHLTRPPKNGPVVRDHWTLLALDKLFSMDLHGKKIPTERFIAHARKICEIMLASQITYSRHPELEGCFTPDGRTTPTATNLEGLLAAYGFLPPDDPLLPKIRKAALLGLEFLLRSQISGGEFKGGMPRAVFVPGVTEKLPIKAQRRIDEIRIDYVQHAMSAMIQYLTLRAEERL